MRRTWSSAQRSADDGAAVVEFALLFPVFIMIVMGTINFGLAFERWIALTQGAREGSRFAATMSITSAGGVSQWLDSVADRTLAASELMTDATHARPGSTVCVALKAAPGGVWQREDVTVSSGGTISRSAGTGDCPGVSAPTGAVNYVQVKVTQPKYIEWILGRANVTISGRSTTRFEAVEP